MTFSKGFNRAIGSSFAGILAIAIAQVALCTGTIAAPIIIGVSIFFIGIITSFMKIWPSLVQYEYAFRVTLFTFCLIVVSGYRMGHSITVAVDRLYSVAIRGIVAVLVNVLVFPDSLEECVINYIDFDGSKDINSSRIVLDELSNESAYKRCRNNLVASIKLQTLASSLKWEPPHGRFKQFSYPWSQYVKIGTILRQCAYEIMALHGVLHSESQAPYNLRVLFKQEMQDLTDLATKFLRGLGQDINNMKRSLQTSTTLLTQLHSLTYQLQWAINQHLHLNNKSNILEESKAILSLVTFCSLLTEIVAKLDHLVETIDELSKMAKFSQYAINPM
ncbi:aluminum-activated malate transporter 9-like [Chenopodium quinoa]|uniref:aluminum-activated malate transporter 9-like n=1 Tax=Chenopodium quinoa TaxID=63459 RepID=UPI000B77CCE7|nr:aluminum-activated malate transporter 9-like [Chenopodium quinoa]